MVGGWTGLPPKAPKAAATGAARAHGGDVSAACVGQDAGPEALSIRLLSDKETGQPRGIGFIEFATAEEAAGVPAAADVSRRLRRHDQRRGGLVG